MRVTDNRYTGELARFDLAVRLIGHEARTGTIRQCTGFTEDRIRKLYGTYFRSTDGLTVRRRRGKSPRQISRFVSSARNQSEATLLASLLMLYDAFRLNDDGKAFAHTDADPATVGARVCQAYETYVSLQPNPKLSFEWAWNLYVSLVRSCELYIAWCGVCTGPYVQDAYALDYHRCPTCELKDQERQSANRHTPAPD